MTQYEDFVAEFKSDPDGFRLEMTESGLYDYQKTFRNLVKFQRNLSYFSFEDMFGVDLGGHLWEKFSVNCNMNLLMFYGMLDHEKSFFLLHKAKQSN